MYVCKHCGSTDVEGTQPAWFKLNGDQQQTSVDSEAEYAHGYCNACDESGDFWKVVERVDAKSLRSIRVVNEAGDAFVVKLVRKGETFGRDHCMTHDEDDPLVEFYDAEYAGKRGFDAEGQFVCRYCASTLRKEWDPSTRNLGLNLHGGEPKWQVSADNMRSILEWLGEAFA